MVLAAFGFQAVGGLVGTAVGFLILFENPDIDAWRWIYASTLVLAVPVTIGRCFIVQSPLWLMFRGRIEEAQAATQRLLLRAPPYPKKVVLHRLQAGDKREYLESPSWSALFRGTNLRRTSLASVPWFLQDLGTYGIGIFTPTILATLIGASIDHPRNTAELIQSDILATKGAAFIDVLLIVGIVFAVLLADRVGRIRLQILGFIGCAVGLLLAALSLHVGGTLSGVLLFGGFMLFSFMTNIGPNAMTYLIAGEVFPTSIRGTGAGFAASFAKIGAVLTAFLFPILLKDIGTDLLLLILVGTSLVGALVTWCYAIETKGIHWPRRHRSRPVERTLVRCFQSEDGARVGRGRDEVAEDLDDPDGPLHERGVARRELTLLEIDVVLKPHTWVAAEQNRLRDHRELMQRYAERKPRRTRGQQASHVSHGFGGRGLRPGNA